MNSINYIACNISYLSVEKFDIDPNFLEILKSFLEKYEIFYNEINCDVALRNETPEHMVSVMSTFFRERFICNYLDKIYNDHRFTDQTKRFIPKYIFLKTEKIEFLTMTYNDHEIYIGDLHTMHQEISALSNALGVVLSERDNYPGGKQKVAFNLIDISWSAINSSMPLIVF